VWRSASTWRKYLLKTISISSGLNTVESAGLMSTGAIITGASLRGEEMSVECQLSTLALYYSSRVSYSFIGHIKIHKKEKPLIKKSEIKDSNNDFHFSQN